MSRIFGRTTKNHSLSRQNESVMSMAEKLNVVIPHNYIWSGSVSSKRGKNMKRKDLNEIYETCKRDKLIKYVIVDEPDRFMRSIGEAFAWEEKFRECNVRVMYTDEELNSDNASGRLLRFLKYFQAEGSNEERITKALKGHEKAIRDGRYTFQPPFGYMRGLVKGVHEIDPNYGSYLKHALISIADGSMNVKEALDWYNENCPDIKTGKHCKLKMDKWRKWIVNPYYAGVVEMDKQVKARNEHGLHEPLITLEQHRRIVAVVSGYKRLHKGPIRGGNRRFPMNKILLCEKCWKANNRVCKFTGYDNKNGKTDKVYSRYYCRGCNMSLARDNAHEQVKQIIDRLDFSEDGRREVSRALNKLWSLETESVKLEVMLLKRDITELKEQQNKIVEQMLDESNVDVKAVYRERLGNLALTIKQKKEEVDVLEMRLKDGRTEFLDFALQFIDHLGTNFFELPLDEVKMCKEILFPGGFWVDSNKKIYTREISPLYRERTTKKDNELSKNALMVGREGLEPPTFSV